MDYLTGGRVAGKGTNGNNTKEGLREGTNGVSSVTEASRAHTY